MALKIRTFRNEKVIAKKFIKELKKVISHKPDARIGLIWDESLASIYELVMKSKKLKWENVKLFSLVEYKDNQTVTFENTLYTEFINKLNNISRQNYESLRERIDELRTEQKLNDLYKFDGLIDLMIFPVDKRGNFLFNDFESKISYINYGNNGNEIITPGIKSIMFAKQIICFAIEDGCENVVEVLNSKKISSKEFYSLLNVHDNITLFTLYSLIKKRQINKNPYVEDKDNIADKVLSTSYEGDLVDELEINDDEEKISDIKKETFGDTSHLSDMDEDDDDEDENEEDDLTNVELSDKEEEIQEEHLANSLEEDDDNNIIDEPLNNDKDNLDDVIKDVIGEEEPTQEELDAIEAEEEYQEESLLDALKDEYASKDEDEELSYSSLPKEGFEDDSEFMVREYDDKFLAENQEETVIGESEVESALYGESEEMDDYIASKLKQMEKLKDQEEYIPEHHGSIDEEIRELESVKQQLEDELKALENKPTNNYVSNDDESINQLHQNTNDINDTFDNDDVSNLANEYTPKHDSVVIYEDDQEDIEVIDETVYEVDNIVETDNNDVLPTVMVEEETPNKVIVDSETPMVVNEYEVPKSKKTSKSKSFDKINNQHLDVDGKTPEEIRKIIAIKEDALRTIELLIKNNQLGIQQAISIKNNDYSYVQPNDIDDIVNNKPDLSLNKNYLKVTYVPGDRPVPLLMIYNEPNMKVYESTILDMIRVYRSNMNSRIFNQKNNHYWNMGAYISHNETTNEIELCAFGNFSNLVFLLRSLNKPVYFYLSKINYELIKDEFDKFSGEFDFE